MILLSFCCHVLTLAPNIYRCQSSVWRKDKLSLAIREFPRLTITFCFGTDILILSDSGMSFQFHDLSKFDFHEFVSFVACVGDGGKIPAFFVHALVNLQILKYREKWRSKFLRDQISKGSF